MALSKQNMFAFNNVTIPKQTYNVITSYNALVLFVTLSDHKNIKLYQLIDMLAGFQPFNNIVYPNPSKQKKYKKYLRRETFTK